MRLILFVMPVARRTYKITRCTRPGWMGLQVIDVVEGVPADGRERIYLLPLDGSGGR